jgi:hypothetical protein
LTFFHESTEGRYSRSWTDHDERRRAGRELEQSGCVEADGKTGTCVKREMSNGEKKIER